jgi:hypothetical protein
MKKKLKIALHGPVITVVVNLGKRPEFKIGNLLVLYKKKNANE